jgi:hypothetical protein
MALFTTLTCTRENRRDLIEKHVEVNFGVILAV